MKKKKRICLLTRCLEEGWFMCSLILEKLWFGVLHNRDPPTFVATPPHQELCLSTQEFILTPVICNLFSTQTNWGHEHPPLSNSNNWEVRKRVPTSQSAHNVCLTTIVLRLSQCMSPSSRMRDFQTLKISTWLGEGNYSLAPLLQAHPKQLTG